MDQIWDAAQSGDGHAGFTARGLIEMRDCAGTTGLHIAAYWGTLDTIKGGRRRMPRLMRLLLSSGTADQSRILRRGYTSHR